jgi:hypothetical protein
MDRPALDKALPLNFPQTFLPDRRLLGLLLAFAANGGSGDKEAIAAETGIPTGKSTGKVDPMIQYGRGMGLIWATKSASTWQLGTTPLGQEVLREDPFLSEPQTLWLLHLMLCRRWGQGVPATGVADAWFSLFAEGRFLLGTQFTDAAFHQALTRRHGAKGYLKSLSTLVPRMYAERACFGEANILTAVADKAGQSAYVRERAPLEKASFPAYALFLFLIWDEVFGADKQLAFDELARETRLLSLLGWEETQVAIWLDWMVSKGMVQLDRYTGTAVLLRLAETPRVVERLYSELV